MRTPDEIKKGLDTCIGEDERCARCSYIVYGDCRTALEVDALKYIQQLECERDAAVELIKGDCKECKHVAEKWFPGCRMNPFCFKCLTNDYCNWQWRGVQKEVE